MSNTLTPMRAIILKTKNMVKDNTAGLTEDTIRVITNLMLRKDTVTCIGLMEAFIEASGTKVCRMALALLS